MERRLSKRGEYPCGLCRVDCETTTIPSVYCGGCNQWYHGPYQQLSNEHMDILAKHIVQDYVCTLYAQTDENFNYRLALERMRLASNRTGTLETALSAATLEGILHRNDPLHVITQSVVLADMRRTDYVAKRLLDKIGKYMHYDLDFIFLCSTQVFVR